MKLDKNINYELIEKHYKENYIKLIKRMTFRLGTQWAAEDVVHTAYERSMRYWRDLEEEQFAKWFNIILMNAAKDHYAAEKGRTDLDEETEEDNSEDDCPHFPEAIMKEIFSLIDTKSVDQIKILSQYFQHGMSARDIALVTEFTYAKTHKTIQRFREELKELYG